MTKKCINRWALNFLASVTLICLLSALPVSEAKALVAFCKCIEDEGPERELEKSVSVFSGKVVDIKWRGGKYDHVEFEVYESWKNPGTSEKKVITLHPTIIERVLGPVVGCGYSFDEGEEYIVYTYRDKISPDKVSSCSRTRKLDQAKEDIEKLGEPIKRFK